MNKELKQRISDIVDNIYMDGIFAYHGFQETIVAMTFERLYYQADYSMVENNKNEIEKYIRRIL